MLSSIGQTLREDAVFLGLFFLAFFAFSLLGLDLFSGSGWSCTDTLKSGPDFCFGIEIKQGIYGTPILLPVAWKGSSFSSFEKGYFDDIWMSMQSLVHVLSMEGWLSIYYAAADLNVDVAADSSASRIFWTGNDQGLLQPKQNTNSNVFIFFLFYIVVFSFFFIQTFAATVLSNIVQKSFTGRLTTEQLRWFLLRKDLKHISPIVQNKHVPPNAVSVAAIFNRREFDIFAMVFSIVNVAIIAASGTNASENQRSMTMFDANIEIVFCAF
jgi:hypothetical protein